jgi:hypothetical protein
MGDSCDVVARECAGSCACPDNADEQFVSRVRAVAIFDERIKVPRAVI